MKTFVAPANTGMIHFLDSARGVFIPQNWLESIDPGYWDTVTPWAREVLTAGPEHSDYWHAWEQIMGSQFCRDLNGNEWTLYQDGDLWLVCDDLMTDEEKENFGFYSDD